MLETINSISDLPKDLAKDRTILSENQVRRLAHLPLLTIFYLSLQRQISATPVTALELAAYLGVDVQVTEEILEYLESKGIVRIFKKDIPAYLLAKSLKEIHAGELMDLLVSFNSVISKEGFNKTKANLLESNQKYRKIYSELASEILQLFGEASANQLPL